MKKSKKAAAGGAATATTGSGGAARTPQTGKPAPASWTFLSNHSHVMLCLYRQPEMRIRELADAVGITERMVQKILAELVEARYLEVDKQGRRNSYRIRSEKTLRHPLESHCRIGRLLEHLDRG